MSRYNERDDKHHSELRQAKESLVALETYHRNLIDYMRSGYACCQVIFEDGDPVDFIYKEVNACYQTMTGLENIVGRKGSEVFHFVEKSYPEFIKKHARVARTGNPERFEICLESLKKWFDVSLYCPQKGLVVSIIEDITERKQTMDELHRLNRALLAINNCNQALLHAHNEEELLRDICHIIVKIGGYRMAWVGYAEQDKAKSIRTVAQAGFDDDYLKELRISWADTQHGHGPAGTAIRTGQPCSTRNILEDLSFEPWRMEALTRGYASIQSLPLKADNKVFGALTIYSAYPDAFNREETKLLTSLADNLAYGITVLQTLNARQVAELALRQSEERFRKLFEYHSAIMLIIDPDTGMILDANPSAAMFYGWPIEELRRMRIQEINTLSPEEVNEKMEKSRSLKQNHFSFRHRRANGSVRDVDVFSNKIEVADKELLYSIIHDVTERTCYEFLISFRLRIIQMAETSSVDELLQTTLDEAERLTQSNIGFVFLIAKDQMSFSKQLCSTSTVNNICQSERGGVHHSLDKDGVWSDAIRERKAVIHNDYAAFRHCRGTLDGHAEVKRELVVPVIRDDRIVAIMGIGNKPGEYDEKDVSIVDTLANMTWDIIAKKIAEEEGEKLQNQLQHSRKMEMIGQLAAGIAHEINNPLNFITINFANIREAASDLQVMLKEYQNAAKKIEAKTFSDFDLQKLFQKETELDVATLIEDIPEIIIESQRGLDRIIAIINAMRNLSHQDTLDKKVSFDINKAIISTLAISRHEYLLCADIETKLEELPLIFCNPEQINQVFLNLVMNSIHAIQSQQRSSKGKIIFHTWFDSIHVYCSIADNGPGIPDAIRKDIFNPFFTTKSFGKGTGLGLSISWDIIVLQHKGMISVDSPAEGGTIFTLSLPRKIPSQAVLSEP